MGLELPVTLGATEPLKILVLNPFQFALHCSIITPQVSKTEQPRSCPYRISIPNYAETPALVPVDLPQWVT
jgi:hypothetical protein